MATAIHSFSQQEMMAYLDGELSPKRAAAAAQHLEQCRECQRLVADFQNLSQTLLGWETAPITSDPPAAQPEVKKKRELTFWHVDLSNLALWKRPSLPMAGALSVLFLICLIGVILAPSRHEQSPSRHEQRMLVDLPIATAVRPGGFVTKQFLPPGAPRASAGLQTRSFVTDGQPVPDAPLTFPSGPLIVRTAQLALTGNHFDQTRAEIERIAKVHQGYVSQLEFNTASGTARVMNATLRVPATQLDTTLEELRRLGHVDEESQRGEDVTQRYVDVNARLANLRITEERLQQILRDHTGKLSDVLQVEEAVDRTRGEIETTEAEQKMLSGQIAFATVNVRVTEEYQATLGGNPSSPLTRLRNAAVRGYRNVVEGVIGLLEFILSTAPALLLIVAIAFYPARWLWRRRGSSFS